MMKVRYIGITENLVLTHGKIYEVEEIDMTNGLPYYRIRDDEGQIDPTAPSYLYPPRAFEIVEED
jgi:hypothetical protein